MKNFTQVLRHPLSEQAIHIDFLRLRCGSEERFQQGIAKVREEQLQESAGAGRKESDRDAIHTFIAFSEWDAVVVVPSSELYARTLTAVYANKDVASSVSGTSGYFAYLWQHPINENWQNHLERFERSGLTVLTSLRFADWFRRDLGVGAELLFCNYLQKQLKQRKYKGITAIAAHSLGWNDVILFTHGDQDAKRLTKLLAEVRLATLRDCVTDPEPLGFSATGDCQIFAASYTHLLGCFDSYMKDELSLGALVPLIESARLLVRVAPAHENAVRGFMDKRRIAAKVRVVPSEMGHYSLSIDLSKIRKDDEGKAAIKFVAETRRFVGDLQKNTAKRRNEPDSYAETTTIFRFHEPKGKQVAQPVPEMSSELHDEISMVETVMGKLPQLLLQRGASAMTSHRFVSVLLTLLDHLSDPVRSSVVRHLSRFARTIPDLVRELDPNGIDDLCHVLEYAVGQAIDGIAQFQHDANALGLSGRGGYSRLIVAAEWYIYSTFARLGISARMPLITFGLRSDNTGSTGRYLVDIPFNVLFVPSRWHILLHEVGHLAWQHIFRWMMESLAIFRAMEREVRFEIRREVRKKSLMFSSSKIKALAKEQVHVDFLRTREILRELFPGYLMFALPCGGNLDQMDALTLRHMMSLGHPASLTRELIVAVVTHCLLEIMDQGVRQHIVKDPANPKDDVERARAWWGIWEGLKNDTHDERIRIAIGKIHNAAAEVTREAQASARVTAAHRPEEIRHTESLNLKLQILDSSSFAKTCAETLHSTVQVLALRARHFVDPQATSLAPVLFGRLLDSILKVQDEQAEYQPWIDEHLVSNLLHAGEVLPQHRDAFVWSRLLLGSRKQLVDGPRSLMMRSQLSVLLSMWHDATTEGYRSEKKLQRMAALPDIVRPI